MLKSLIFSFGTLFSKTNSSRSILESIKSLEAKSFMPFKLDFANNACLSWFFFFLVISAYFLFPAVMTKTLDLIAKLVIYIGIPSKEAKAEI